jgi:membrane protease YdiL (CAAX protease family)
VCLAGLAIANSFAREANPQKSKDFSSETQALKMAMVQKKLVEQTENSSLGDQSSTALDLVVSGTQPDAKTVPEAAKLRLIAQKETKKALDTGAVDLLLAQKNGVDRAFGTIFSQRSSKDEIAAAVQAIPPTSFLNRMGRYEGKALLGEKDAGKELRLGLEIGKLAIAFIWIGVVFLCCPVVWILFLISRSNGSLKPAAPSLGKISVQQADSLALKAIQILVLFLVLPSLIAIVGQKVGLSPEISSTVALLAFVAAVLAVVPRATNGDRFTLKQIGYSKQNLGKHMVWGFAAFAAELPVGLLIAVGSTALLKWLPTPHHSAVDVLQKSESLAGIAITLVFGVLIAAFWEEILFRGILFPAMAKVLNGPVVGALASSLCFAAIHPQGIVLWAPLAWMGGMSCFLARYSGSLVPSFFLHALHNLTLMTLVLVLR